MTTIDLVRENYIRALLYALYKEKIIDYEQWQETLNKIENGSISELAIKKL